MKTDSEQRGEHLLLITLIWPFAGLINALQNWREPWAKNIFWLACIYMGAIQIYHPAGTILGDGVDGGRYVMVLQQMHNSNITLNDILSLYLNDEYFMDLYQQLTTFLVSRFTDNGHILFAVFALVFGFFYSRNIWYVLERIRYNNTNGFFLLISLLFLVCPITSINGVRMWTALHVFIYGALPYVCNNDKRKLWAIAIAPLIHFSFLYITILSLIYIAYFRNKTPSRFWINVFFILFVITFFIKALDLTALSSLLQQYSPDAYENRIDQYVNQDVSSKTKANNALMNWYVNGSKITEKWFLDIFIVLIFFTVINNKSNISNSLLIRLFAFFCFIGSYANICSLIPAGGRFQSISQIFEISIILIALSDQNIESNIFSFYSISSYILLLPFVVQVRSLLDYYGISLIFGNFLTALFWEDNVMMIDYIKYFVI